MQSRQAEFPSCLYIGQYLMLAKIFGEWHLLGVAIYGVFPTLK